MKASNLVLLMGLVGLGVVGCATKVEAEAIDFKFSFTGDEGTSPGIETGVIQIDYYNNSDGLKPIKDVIIGQNTVGIPTNTVLDTFLSDLAQVTNGNITYLDLHVSDSTFNYQLFLNYNGDDFNALINKRTNPILNSANKDGFSGATYTQLSTPTYYRMSTYGGIKTGPNGQGLVPDKKTTFLVPFTTPPDPHSIYTDGTNDSKDYVLDTSETKDGSGTQEDLQSLQMIQPLPSFESAKAILSDTLSAFLSGQEVKGAPSVGVGSYEQNNTFYKQDNTGIRAYFIPRGESVGSVTLGSLAKALGYSSFNWVSKILEMPSGRDLYDGNGNLEFSGNQPVVNPVFDPGINGYYTCFHATSNCSIRKKFDSLPYYLDVPGFGGIEQGLQYDKYIKMTNYPSLYFYDSPFIPDILNDGDYALFHTELVGVKEGDSTYSNYSLIPGFDFVWRSNFSCATADCVLKVGQLNTILSTPISSPIDFSSLGLTPDDFQGGITILNVGDKSSVATVPEPSSVGGFLLSIPLLLASYILKKKSKRSI